MTKLQTWARKKESFVTSLDIVRSMNAAVTSGALESLGIDIPVSWSDFMSLLHILTTLRDMNNSQNSRPASQLIAGFATPSTPASARSTLRHSRSAQPPGPPTQPVHGEESPSVTTRPRRETD